MIQTSRRGMLTTLGAFAAAGAVTAAAAACGADQTNSNAGTDQRPPTFVLVGGNGAPSFFWMPVVRALSLLGHRAHPVEFPLHGLDAEFSMAYQAPQDLDALHQQQSTLGKLTLTDYAKAVVDVLEKAHRNGPVVLVGHSLGGTSVTLAANMAHELIDRLVYVSAICCTARKSALDYVLGPENRGSLGLAETLSSEELSQPDTTSVTYTNLRANDQRYLTAYRQSTMAEASENQFLAMLNFCCQPIENAAVSLEDARGDAATWGTIPRTYIRLTADRFNTLPNQNRMIADADATTPRNPFDVHDLDASHVGVILKADQLAGILADLTHHL